MQGATTRRLDRAAVTTTFRDGKHLVLADDEANELRRELAGIGILVREDKTRQHWRARW